MKWNLVTNGLPPRGAKVDWIGADGTEVVGGTYDGVWFRPDGRYTYLPPLFWRRHGESA